MQHVALGIVLGACIAVASYRARFLTKGGAVATFFLASIIFGVGGWKWTTPMVAFFVLSSLLSGIGKRRKKEFESVFEKSGTRDEGQVLANGGVGGVLAALQFLFPSFDFYPLYLGSVAAVTADTWATEIGLLSRGKTVSIASFKAVPAGSNGGISAAGLFAGVLGAAMIAVSAWFWQREYKTFAVVIIAGFAGSLVDSILGATIQAGYECPVCGKRTERKIHCEGVPTHLVRGFPWIDNDVVNVCCAVSGSVAAAILTRVPVSYFISE